MLVGELVKPQIFASILATVSGCASIENSGNEFAGNWQFPDRWVWIEIYENGDVFQCRIDVDKSVISSKGKLDGRSIYWDHVWGIEQVRREQDTIYILGNYGEFGFELSKTKMIEECDNPFNKSK